MEHVAMANVEDTGQNEVTPHPMVGHHDMEVPLAAFPMKVFDMVEDSSSDDMVSWSTTSNSFIVWDLHRFSESLLPKYFKHKNFTSFIRQLNTYGFKKIDADRWEFANECFLRGQKHLLKNIKRKNHPCTHQQNHHPPEQQPQQGSDSRSHQDVRRCDCESRFDQLRRDHNIASMEIFNLKQQLRAIEERLQDTERKLQYLMNFLARALHNPTFLRNLRH